MRIEGKRYVDFVCDNAMEIIGERMAYLRVEDSYQQKTLALYTIYKNKIQVD